MEVNVFTQGDAVGARNGRGIRKAMLQSAARDLKLGLLTPQERECLRLVAQQRSSKEIAHELGISKASVDTYCNRARAKLGVATRRDAAQLVASFDAVPESTIGGAQVLPTAEPAPLAPPTVTLLPPLSSLGPMARLGIILAGAVVLALAFGMLVSGLQSLNEVLAGAQARS